MIRVGAQSISFIAILLFITTGALAQFYRGTEMEFGKNRLQFEIPNWQHIDFQQYNVYFYGTGKELAHFTAIESQKTLRKLEKILDYRMRGKVYILVFNTYGEFKESNIGLSVPEGNNTGGSAQLQGNTLFIYFDGDHTRFKEQIWGGLTEVIVKQMMFGNSWKEMVKNSALMTVPEWYIDGLVSYAAQPWSVVIDDQLRDVVLSERLNKFNKLVGEEARFAGHALWYYIAETYGPDVIPNIVYMAKISRSIESGFLFVLGFSLNDLVEDAREYYLKKYEADEKYRDMPDGERLKIKTKKRRSYHRPVISPDGNYIVYTSNELGQYKVWLYDLNKKKRKRLLRGDFRLDRVIDPSNPIYTWHPDAKKLAIVRHHKGKNQLIIRDIRKSKKEIREFRNLEKVLSFSYSTDGRYLVLSALKDGQTDLFTYSLATSSMVQITDDIYDDLNPSFVPGSKEIIFTSNRISDSVRIRDDFELIGDNKDIFLYDYKAKPETYKRIVRTDDVDEELPFAVNDRLFTFLSGESGIINRYVGVVDSTISRVDTAIHYRYFTRVRPISNYKRNILHHSLALDAEKFVELLRYKRKYQFYLEGFEDVHAQDSIAQTTYRQAEDQRERLRARSRMNKVRQLSVTPVVERAPPSTDPDEVVNVHNYRFLNEAPPTDERDPVENSKAVTLKVPKAIQTLDSSEDQKLKFPRQENYREAFRATEIITQVDFNFANQIYQPFNGGPYINPGMGAVVKAAAFDLMEDLYIEGGVRIGFNGENSEYFIKYINRRKRLDKEVGFQRQALQQEFNSNEFVKSLIHQVKGTLSWPVNDVLAIKGTLNLRYDRNVVQSTDDRTLPVPDSNIYWTGLKFELIYDDTRDRGLNLYNGTRFKIFAESYMEVDFQNNFGPGQTDIHILGFDFRNYKRIHRSIIWANRLAGSTSFGGRKLVYYLGSVDNWIVLSDQPRFNFEQNIAQNQNYYWQALATNLRGFNQNIRNGNSFVVLNSELRIPIFQYLIQKPIKSDFIKNFQVIGFGDVGTAWNGVNPYSDENAFNTRTISTGPGGNLIIRLDNKKDPFVGAIGFGLRTKLLGYFLRWDYAWGIEDGIFQRPMAHFSMGLDF